MAGQPCPTGYIPSRLIASPHLTDNLYTPLQWRNIKQQEFDQAEAAYNQASIEAEQARESYNERVRAKSDAAIARSRALSALSIAKSRVSPIDEERLVGSRIISPPELR